MKLLIGVAVVKITEDELKWLCFVYKCSPDQAKQIIRKTAETFGRDGAKAELDACEEMYLSRTAEGAKNLQAMTGSPRPDPSAW